MKLYVLCRVSHPPGQITTTSPKTYNMVRGYYERAEALVRPEDRKQVGRPGPQTLTVDHKRFAGENTCGKAASVFHADPAFDVIRLPRRPNVANSLNGGRQAPDWLAPPWRRGQLH